MVLQYTQGSAPVYLREIIQPYKPKHNLSSNSQNLTTGNSKRRIEDQTQAEDILSKVQI